eukprot:s301_g7.t1
MTSLYLPRYPSASTSNIPSAMAPTSPTSRTQRLAAQLVASRSTAAVPREFDVPPGSDDAEFAGHLRWMAQKMELGQDMLLLGPPGSLRRQLALRFCELQGREAEVLTVTRDTTESDLKQRRELSRSTGSRTIYADSAPVRCALRGRVLVLDGLEKAERNVLPTLNNLLENREMQLDDGRLLIPARRYDVLSQQEISAEEGKAKLVRVHEDFRVVALAVPCPPWPGNPLDPPLRSRFQARIIMPPTLLSTTQLAPFFRLPAAGGPELETLLRRLTALHRALETGQMPGGVRSPTLTYDAIFRLLRLVLSHSELRPSAGEALLRAYPVGLLCGTKTAVRDATEQLLRHFDLAPEPRTLMVQPSRSQSSHGMVHLELQDGGAIGSLSLPSPLLPAASSNSAPFVAGAALQTLLARLVQDFASGSDCLLVGPAGCGKSALARHLAGLLGHGAPGGFGLEFFFLHEEMSSRDLLQRRATSDQGDTIWVDSPLVRAARSGAMCILDGAHRLKGDALCALAPLLQDRQACLSVAGDSQGAGWELLLRSDRFALQGEKSFDAAAGCLVAAIHPSFKVLALAEPPTAQLPWLTEEVSACFATHSYPEQTPQDLVDLLGTLVPSLPSDSAQRFVDALSATAATPAVLRGGAVEVKEERLSVPLRVLLRVAKASAAEKGDEVELLHGLLQQQLFPFMPKGERSKLISQLSMHFPATAALAAERALHRSTRSEAGKGTRTAELEGQTQPSRNKLKLELCTLSLLMTSHLPGRVCLTVCTPSGHSCTIAALASGCVDQLHRAVEEALKIPNFLQRFICEGREIYSKDFLADLRLEDGSIITVMNSWPQKPEAIVEKLNLAASASTTASDALAAAVAQCLKHKDSSVKVAALSRLSWMGIVAAPHAAAIAKLLRDKEQGVRSAAADALLWLEEAGAAYAADIVLLMCRPPYWFFNIRWKVETAIGAFLMSELPSTRLTAMKSVIGLLENEDIPATPRARFERNCLILPWICQAIFDPCADIRNAAASFLMSRIEELRRQFRWFDETLDDELIHQFLWLGEFINLEAKLKEDAGIVEACRGIARKLDACWPQWAGRQEGLDDPDSVEAAACEVSVAMVQFLRRRFCEWQHLQGQQEQGGPAMVLQPPAVSILLNPMVNHGLRSHKWQVRQAVVESLISLEPFGVNALVAVMRAKLREKEKQVLETIARFFAKYGFDFQNYNQLFCYFDRDYEDWCSGVSDGDHAEYLEEGEEWQRRDKTGGPGGIRSPISAAVRDTIRSMG